MKMRRNVNGYGSARNLNLHPLLNRSMADESDAIEEGCGLAL
jgi:hypothetical protein